MKIQSFNHNGEKLGKTMKQIRAEIAEAESMIATLDEPKDTPAPAGVEMFSKIIIPLTPRTKKNSQQIRKNHVTGQRFVAPSNTFLVYQNQCFPYLYQMRSNADALPYPLNIKCLFYMPTKRRVDLVNLLEAIDDILVHYKIIVDDSAAHIGGHDGSRVLYDKDNPRTELYFSTLDGNPFII